MRAVAIEGLDTKALTLTGQGGTEAVFAFPAPEGVEPRTVKVRSDGTMLRFFPDRSAGHRDVLKELGLTV